MRIDNNNFKARTLHAFFACVALAFANSALGFEITVSSSDADQCDPLVVPVFVDELGPIVTGFPPDERIDSEAIPVPLESNCGSGGDAGAHFEIVITNRTDRTFDRLWTVADTGDYWIGNYDGYIEGAPAMRIDRDGVNAPLVSESMVADGLFEPNEIWRFRLYNWVGPSPYLCSPGLVGLNSDNVLPSNFSIVALEANAADDTDSDGVPDYIDNCTERTNPAQVDTNLDNIGNSCDPDIGSAAGVGVDDCAIDFADLAFMKQAFFSMSGAPNWNPNADLSGPAGTPDGFVNYADLSRMKEYFLGSPGPSALGCN